jgi:hypothetical protein
VQALTRIYKEESKRRDEYQTRFIMTGTATVLCADHTHRIVKVLHNVFRKQPLPGFRLGFRLLSF